ncbi:uncharacterized protein LOC144169174 isoform X2 [Haemaphysalis longicornis]
MEATRWHTSLRCALLAVMTAWSPIVAASATYDQACSGTPLNTFYLEQTLGCGYNADSWSIWIPPTGPPYCLRDSLDKSDKGDFVCYAVNPGNCHASTYIYAPVYNQVYLERHLQDGGRSRCLVLDTDNCKYMAYIECFPDGTVWRYFTYKSSWTESEIKEFKRRIEKEPSLSFLSPYTFNCSSGEL